MNIFKFAAKLIVQIFFVIIFFSTLQAKNLDKFKKGENISNYFSGILLLNQSKYNESYSFLNKLDGLESEHLEFSSKFLYSLISLGKYEEAFKYAKKLEKKELDSFESNLILGVYHLKINKSSEAKKYFIKLKSKNSNLILNNFISNFLINWSDLEKLDLIRAETRINLANSEFKNLKNIENVFLHCFYKSTKTDLKFKELVSNNKVDFSRYNYFYASYLVNLGKIDKAQQLINTSLNLFPRNLLLNQYNFQLQNKIIKNNFNCQNHLHVIAEIFYVTANALSSQSIYTLSNFYINLAKFLNSDFYSFDTLIAENFYKIGNFKEAKKIYKKMEDFSPVYMWFAAKQNAKILIKEGNKDKALKILTDNYEKLKEKNIYEIYEYADFLKSNDQLEKSISYYTEVIEKIDRNHVLYPEVLEGRGVVYERTGNWDKAEKDLLASLEVSPDQAYVINYLAYSWIEQGINIEESLKMLEKANKLKSNDPYIIDSLGWALFKLKKYKDAKKYLEIAVQLMPEDPIISDHYGDVLWKNGKKIQAKYYWKYALNLKDTKKELKNSLKNKLISGL